MASALVCKGCGGLVAEDYWSEHEAFHRRVGGKAEQAEFFSFNRD